VRRSRISRWCSAIVAASVPREGHEARPLAVAVGGEHRADPAVAVGVGADDDVVRPDAAEHRLPGRERKAVDGAAEIRDERAARHGALILPRPSRGASHLLPVQSMLHGQSVVVTAAAR
jgi:hypothetical protein